MVFLALLITFLVVMFFYKNTNPQISVTQRYILSLLRFVAIGSIILLIFNPIIKIKKQKSLVMQNIVLNDVSKSMYQNFSGKKKTEYYTDLIDLFKKTNFKIINFANGVNGDINSTDLLKTFRDIKKLFSEKSLKNIVLLSDGWFDNDNFDFVKKLGLPIFTIFPSVKENGTNLSVKSIKFNLKNYTDEETPILVELNSKNYKSKAKVELFINGKLYKSKKIDFKNSNSAQVTFFKNFKKQGIYSIKAMLNPIEQIQETTLEDNKKIEAINILKSKKNVLILSDKLNWDLKFITRALKKNKHLKVINLTYERQFFIGKKSTTLLKHFENLSNLIIINYGKLYFNAQQKKLIKQFLKNGGALLYIGKPNLSVLPVKTESFESGEKFSIHLSQEATDYITFDWDESEIPPLETIYTNAKPTAKILAYFDNPEKSPAILIGNYHKGKIAYFSFFGLWRWQMWNKNSDYDNFVLNLNSWLSTGEQKRYKLLLNKSGFALGEQIEIKLLAYDEKLSPLKNLNLKLILKDNNSKIVEKSFMLENDDGYYLEKQIFTPGKYFLEIYKDNKKVAFGKFIVFNITPETYNRGFNIINLKYISQISGGKSFYIDDFDIKNFMSYINGNREKSLITIFKEIPLYKKIYFVLIFILSFVIELYLRKRWGLL